MSGMLVSTDSSGFDLDCLLTEYPSWHTPCYRPGPCESMRTQTPHNSRQDSAYLEDAGYDSFRQPKVFPPRRNYTRSLRNGAGRIVSSCLEDSAAGSWWGEGRYAGGLTDSQSVGQGERRAGHEAQPRHNSGWATQYGMVAPLCLHPPDLHLPPGIDRRA